MSGKARSYCYTKNNYTQEEVEAIKAIESTYHVIGFEIGESGTPHLQGYIHFKNARSFKAVHKELFNAHIEPTKGTPEQASEYSKKDGEYWEQGECPKQGKRTDVELVREEINNGNGMRGVVRIATNLQQIKMAEAILKYEEPQRNWKPHVTWCFGATATGKSKYAHEVFSGLDFFRKTSNQGKWWDGYDAHQNVIIDDIDSKTMPYKCLLDLLDRYACVIECKGGTRQFLAKNIIVTTSRHPADMFRGEDQYGRELLRRLDRILEFKAINDIKEYDMNEYVCQAISQQKANDSDEEA